MLSFRVLLACGITCLAIGFVAGIVIGKGQGYRRGRTEAAVLLRIEALEAGQCPVCNALCSEGCSSAAKSITGSGDIQ